jgi:hypothetical protein
MNEANQAGKNSLHVCDLIRPQLPALPGDGYLPSSITPCFSPYHTISPYYLTSPHILHTPYILTYSLFKTTTSS